MPTFQIRQNGQINLPVKFCKGLELKNGDIIDAEIQNGQIILTPPREFQYNIDETAAVAERANIEKLKRFHKLVDKRLDENLKENEQAELEALEAYFDEDELAIMASLEPKRREIEIQSRQVKQLMMIGVKLDELLCQFDSNEQNQK